MRIVWLCLVPVLGLALPCAAAEDVNGVVQALKDQVKVAEAIVDPAQRLRSFERARMVFEAKSRAGAADALAGAGITAEALAERSMAARLDLIHASRDPAQRNWHETEAEALAVGLSKEKRVAALVSIGRAVAENGDKARARALLERALAEASPQNAPDLTRLAASIGGLMDIDLLRAVRSSPDVTARAALLQGVARDDAETKNELPLQGELRHAVGSTFSVDRQAALDEIADEALVQRRADFAELAIVAMDDPVSHDRALSRLLDGLVAQGNTIRALRIVRDLTAVERRAQRFRDLAVTFHKAGYKALSDGCFEEAIAAARDMGPDAIAMVVRSLASTKRETRALAETASLTGAARSYALAGVARRLADAGRLAEAERLLPELMSDSDRSFALSGIWKAKVKGAEPKAIEVAIAGMSGAEDRDRVRMALIEELVDRRSYSKALEIAAVVDDVDLKLEAILDVGVEAGKEKALPLAREAFAKALETVKLGGAPHRDERLVQIVAAQSRLGEIEAGGAVAALIANPDQQIRAKAEIAKGFARTKNFANAYRAVDDIGGSAVHGATLAFVALEEAKGAEDLRPIVERLRTIGEHNERRAAFRSLAEAASKRLTNQKSSAETSTEAPVVREPVSYIGGGVEVSHIAGQPALKPYTPPAGNVAVHDVRAQVPLPRDGRFGIGLLPDEAQFKRFRNERLVKDDDGGLRIATSLDPAITAQGLPAGRYINVAQGIVTISDIARAFPDDVRISGDNITIRIPINIARGATLLMLGGDAKEFRLSEEDGAFIMNGGRLFVVDSAIVGWNMAANAPSWRSDKYGSKTFRPFIGSWTASDTIIAGSRLTALGYQMTKAFGLTITTGPHYGHIDTALEPTGQIVDNTIENLEYGFYSYEGRDIAIVGNEFRDNLIYAVDPHDRSHRLMIAYNTTYGSLGKHGIIVSREVDRSWIIGNVSFANAGSGIMLERESVGNVVYGNASFDNEQDGITVFESSCNLILRNDMFRNKRSGLKIRNSADIGVYHNAIRQNAQRGIEAYIADLSANADSQDRDFSLDPYSPVTTFSAGWNIIGKNTVGISMAGVSGAALIENSFRFAGRRLLGGDAERATGTVLAGRSSLVASQCRPKRAAYTCPLREQGLLTSELMPDFSDPDATNDCTSISGTVQSTAFIASRDGS
ncbi:right-handed parallel beta-helix repeat-containing protein [Flaviflagellibacter deserti]|uniref:Right-handed parallel beta-helix repeat-containing protein n=1 Tax=Flaviflagellibacter deserti TaxID=2267266 RepID=A0ABV9Z2X5_9HYPH